MTQRIPLLLFLIFFWYVPFGFSHVGIFSNLAKGETSFSLEDLPQGKSVTLPHRSRSIMELPGHVTLKGTDHNQTVKFYSFHKAGNVSNIKLSIYDNKSTRVRHITLKPDSPVIYHLEAHHVLRVKAEQLDQVTVSSKRNNSKMSLVLESNRPLQLTRTTLATKG